MKKLKRLVIGLVLFVVALIIFNMCTYTTKENQYSVIKRFGKIENITTEAGLKSKTPLIDSVNYISKSTQIYDIPASEVITADKKTMIINAYILWHVTDPKVYTQALNASTSTAEGRIDVIVYNAIKTTISSMTQEEVIMSRDDELDITNADATLDDVEINDYENAESTEEVEVVAMSEKLLAHVGEQCKQYGIEIEDIQIKVLDLPNENKEAVYNRMITERNNIAAAYTAQGQSEAQIIKNTTNKEISIIKSEAEAKAAATIAEGEAEYMRILSDAYNNPEKADFYMYTLSLDAAKNSLKKGQTTLFLDADSPIAKIFQGEY